MLFPEKTRMKAWKDKKDFKQPYMPGGKAWDKK